jgi:hypothetical protein
MQTGREAPMPRSARIPDDAPLNTVFFLMAQYRCAAVIPIEDVCRDYFRHLTPEKLVRKVSLGEIALPLVRIEASQKSAKGVHISDLAQWLDDRAEAARKECRQLCG